LIILIIHIIVSYDQNISLSFFMRKMDPMSGFDIRLVFTLAPRDSTLQYKRCEHFWNNFPCITSLVSSFEKITSSKLSIISRVICRKTTAGWCRNTGGASLQQDLCTLYIFTHEVMYSLCTDYMLNRLYKLHTVYSRELILKFHYRVTAIVNSYVKLNSKKNFF